MIFSLSFCVDIQTLSWLLIKVTQIGAIRERVWCAQTVEGPQAQIVPVMLAGLDCVAALKLRACCPQARLRGRFLSRWASWLFWVMPFIASWIANGTKRHFTSLSPTGFSRKSCWPGGFVRSCTVESLHKAWFSGAFLTRTTLAKAVIGRKYLLQAASAPVCFCRLSQHQEYSPWSEFPALVCCPEPLFGGGNVRKF